jgi:hypothetical protein
MTPAQEQLDKVKGILNQDAKKRLFEKTRGSVTGSAIGLTAGAMYGAFSSKNVFVTSFAGLLLGGLVGYLLTGDTK